MGLYYDEPGLKVYLGDVLDELKTIPDDSVQCVVTSPPYWGLRDYKVEGQLGLEGTPDEYVAKMVDVFREARRVLRMDGTCWIDLGDTTRNKQLIGIPWRVAFALQADGWYLRQDIIWHKPNPMPESVRDRCTKSHEYIFLLTKSARYYYDADAISEPLTESSIARLSQPNLQNQKGSDRVQGKTNGPMKAVSSKLAQAAINRTGNLISGGTAKSTLGKSAGKTWEERKAAGEPMRHGLAGAAACGAGNFATRTGGRNKRSVWTITPKSFKGAHFATFPPELPRTCILAGTKEGDTVLDPFHGSGTTAMVALDLGREYVGIELNEDYIRMRRWDCLKS
jgi:DNA modification methylase